MEIVFWGTRGSLPTPLSAQAVRAKLVAALTDAAARPPRTQDEIEAFVDRELDFAQRATYGGHTSCVEIRDAGSSLICDMGSGARDCALAALARQAGGPATYDVLMSHLHWDHTMGFPFFVPAYIAGNRIRIHGCHDELEAAFRRQHSAPHFPVDFGDLAATIEFVRLEPGVTTEIAGFRVTPRRQLHAGVSYGYRIESNHRALVYTTDAEHKFEDPAEVAATVAFLRSADLVIFDTMYSLADAFSVKEDWGHSSNIVAVELCQAAAARRLCLFHHEPILDDARIDTVLAETLRLEEITRAGPALEIVSAYDGLKLEI